MINIGQNQEQSVNNQQKKEAEIITPQDVGNPLEMLIQLMQDMSVLMNIQEQTRKFVYELSEHHNSLVREFRTEIEQLKNRLKALEEKNKSTDNI